METEIEIGHTDEASMSRWLSGEELYGEELSPERVTEWLAAESTAYGDLPAHTADQYPYHAVNIRYGFRHLPPVRFAHVLAYGAAAAAEIAPISDRIESLSVVEPDARFHSLDPYGVPTRWIAPGSSPDLPIEDGSVDLITCLGVLHHIPRVTPVLAEFARVLGSGGHAVIREPITSMGDWRNDRPGLTRNERGLPAQWFIRALNEAGLEPVKITPCFYGPLGLLGRRIKIDIHNNELLVRLDEALARLTAKRARYHATSVWQKSRPTAMCVVVRRGGK